MAKISSVISTRYAPQILRYPPGFVRDFFSFSVVLFCRSLFVNQFQKMGNFSEYLNEAQVTVPKVANDLEMMQQPVHLQDLAATLVEYEKTFYQFKETCALVRDNVECPTRDELRSLGQDLVRITEDLVLFEQGNFNNFIANFKVRLAKTVLLLVVLSIFTLALLYFSIIIPLKRVENAAIDIANGTFSRVPVDDKKGEVRSVLRAFNKMVTDLEEKQEQLFQAKKLSSIGTLASGTVHQINNPLNNISTSCQLALTDVDRTQFPFTVKMLETIAQETERAGEIVRGLLEFSRAQTFSLQLIPLVGVVQKVMQLAASEVPAGITITTDIPEDLILNLDVQKMTEALLNLVLNAIQAIEEPPGVIAISARVDGKSGQAVLTVADTGIGIEKDDLPRIFDPFFTTKNAENGTGLGLAVVYGIIKKQSGSTRVESIKGQGTKIIMTLPLSRDLAGNKSLKHI